MNLKRTGSRWDRKERIDINDNWDVIEKWLNQLSERAQDLVAEGQLTPGQYAELLKTMNRLIDEGDLEETKASVGAMVNALIQQFNLKPMDNPIYIENLWKPEESVPGTLGSSGDVSNHETNRTTPLIEILPNQNYRFEKDDGGVIKVSFYGINENHLQQTDWIGNETIKSPSNSKYMRVSLAMSQDTNYLTVPFYISIGDYVPQGVKDGDAILYDGGFWENIPTPPLNVDSVGETHIKDGVITENKLSEDIKDKVFPESIIMKNLWDITNTTTGTLSETSGSLNSHATNRVSDFIEIYSGEYYSFQSERGIKVVFYDDSQNFIEGHGWLSSGQTYTFMPPLEAKYIRLNMGVTADDDAQGISFVANVGESIMLPEEEGKVLSNSFWDEQPDGVVKKRHIDNSVFDNVKSNGFERSLQPFPRKLKFDEIGTGWDEVNHLSQDGEVVYFKFGKEVRQSLDDGDTIEVVYKFPQDIPSIQAVRDLADGELLVSTTRDEDINLKSKVYKSVGYDRNNPENTQFVEVLEAISSQANIYSSWGLEAQDNICLASEYGMRDVDGARHVYLSTDYGETWQMIFDQKTTTEDIEGAPTWTTSAHLHTVHYDRYFDRIWLVVGDNPNTATYYSDDMGQTWNYVSGSGKVQYTGIVSFPDGVIFGSDRNPNGIHKWERTESKDDPVVIEPLELINDENAITHVFQRAFRRYAKKGEPAFFPATRISDYRGQYSSVIMSMTGVGGAHNVYELPAEHSSLGFYNVVGITAKGNILTSHHNGSDHSILRAKAPLFE